MKLKSLETKKKMNGYLYEIIKRTEDTALVKVTNTVRKKNLIGYEIWVIRIEEVTEWLRIHSKKYIDFDFFEKAPCDEDFGTYGWFYPNREMAEAHIVQKPQGSPMADTPYNDKIVG